MTERFYDVLGVAEDATQEEIRAAYREQVKRYHPDVSDRDDAREKFKLVKEAEEVLGDPVRRERYDQVGHDAYVGSDDTEAATDDPDGDDVRAAAARAAAGEHDAGGRSAGWRERERRARQARRRTGRAGSQRHTAGTGPDADDDPWDDWMGDAEEWMGSDTAAEGDATGGGAASDRSPGDDPWTDWFDEGNRTRADSGGAAAAESGHRTASSPSTDGASASARRGSRTADRSPWDPAAGPHRRASDGGTTAGATARSTARSRGSSGGSTHAVEDWRDDAGTSRLRPNWTQDDAVLLAACILLYPIVLVSAVFPPFHTAANVAIGLVGLAFVGFLLPRPSFAIPVFGTWSVLAPVALVALGVPIVSGLGLLAIGATWLPLLYALTIGYVFLKTG